MNYYYTNSQGIRFVAGSRKLLEEMLKSNNEPEPFVGITESTGGLQSEPSKKMGVCEVCRLVDGDSTEKQGSYCGLCKAFICFEHRKNWTARAVAALKRKFTEGKSADYKTS